MRNAIRKESDNLPHKKMEKILAYAKTEKISIV